MEQERLTSNPGNWMDDQRAGPQGDPLAPDVSQDQEVGARLDQGKRLAEAGDLARARACLEGVLGPVLDRPWALGAWMELIRLLEPSAENRLRRAITRWIRTAREVLEEGPVFSGIGEPGGPLRSQTIARLYWNQGHRGKALEIYRDLVQRDPQDMDLLEEFGKRLAEARDDPDAGPDVLRALEEWAIKIRSRRGQLASGQPRSDIEARHQGKTPPEPGPK